MHFGEQCNTMRTDFHSVEWPRSAPPTLKHYRVSCAEALVSLLSVNGLQRPAPCKTTLKSLVQKVSTSTDRGF